MIIRVVDLQIQPEAFVKAKSLLDEVAPKVRGFEGCLHLELNFDIHRKGHIQTYSKWVSEEALNVYRNSEVFIIFWKSIKPLFLRPASAWSFKSQEIEL